MTIVDTSINTLQDLKLLPQWVCYRSDKVPFQPSGIEAKANDPLTWSTFSEVVRACKQSPDTYAGIGFEFVKEQGITGVDLDKCIDDEGQISLYAQEIIKRLNSYTEYSPSKKGFHILVRGSIPKNITSDPDGMSKIEMYDCKRYFTMTGNRLSGTPETFEDRQEELSLLHQEVTAQREQAKAAKQQAKQPPAQYTTRTVIGGDTPYGQAALERECQEVATTGEGGRNARLNAAAFSLGQLVGGNELTRSTVERELYHAADRCGLSHSEIEKTLRSGIESGMEKPRTAPVDDLIYGPTPGSQGNGNSNNNHHNTRNGSRPGPDAQFVIECLHEGEYGDARLFSYLFRGIVLFDHTAKEWYTWAGHWWEEDTTEKIKHLVSGKLASVYIRAGADLNTQASQQEAKAEASGDEQEKESATQYVGKVKGLIKELSGRAFSLRQISRCKNVLNFASSFDGMGIKAEQWDRNPWLLACPNGVIDLKTGLLRDGRPEDYIRTICPTEWKGIATPAPRWERFLQEIFELKLISTSDGKKFVERTEQERDELISFKRRLLGYGITGEVIEHIFAVLYGEDGRNGKDTIQRAVSRTLGKASTAISKDVLLDTGRMRSAGAPTPHLSDLQGKRLAWAREPEQGARFSVGQVKEYSGGGEIPTRGLHEKKFTKIQPSHLLILLTNHKPHADANDEAFWDRLRLITFNMRFVDNPVEPNERKKDTQLWATLEQEASGILAWLVRGCLEWQEQGLNTPQSVLDDGKQYRKDEDDLIKFLEECCIIAEGKETKASNLYAAYETWAKSGNLYTINRTLFGIQMGKKKFAKKPTNKGIIYLGIGLLNPESEGLVNSFEKHSTTSKLTPQATLDDNGTDGSEGCEQFKQVFTKNHTHEGKNSEKPVKTIHTIHSTFTDSLINQPVEPYQEGVNSPKNPSQTIHAHDQKFATRGNYDHGNSPYTFEVRGETTHATLEKYAASKRVTTPEGEGWLVWLEGMDTGVVLDSDTQHTYMFKMWQVNP